MDPKSVKRYQFFDIAANLSDEQFQGEYFGKKHHESDINDVIERASNIGRTSFLKFSQQSGCLTDLIHSIQLCRLSNFFYTTAGIHPCRANEPKKSGDSKLYWSELIKQIDEGINEGKIIAVGECGLDYDRLSYATKEDQLEQFPLHFEIAEKYNLPMYLHNRNTGNDFFEIVGQNRHRFPGGIVHSFTGTEEELNKILALDLYVGVNGCSLKTEENIRVAKLIPLDRLMLETDSPYCEIRNSHASSKLVESKFQAVRHEKFKKGCMVKSRNEPCTMVQILEVMAKLKNISEQELADICYENTIKFFKLN